MKIPLTGKGALLHFKHSTDAIANITPIDITEGMVPWTPQKFEDDPYQIQYDINFSVIITHYKPSPILKKRGIPRKKGKEVAQVNQAAYKEPEDIFYDL